MSFRLSQSLLSAQWSAGLEVLLGVCRSSLRLGPRWTLRFWAAGEWRTIAELRCRGRPLAVPACVYARLLELELEVSVTKPVGCSVPYRLRFVSLSGGTVGFPTSAPRARRAGVARVLLFFVPLRGCSSSACGPV